MGHIKEPKGIDLVVVPQTKPDKEADKLVSNFIRKDKTQRKALIQTNLKSVSKI